MLCLLSPCWPRILFGFRFLAVWYCAQWHFPFNKIQFNSGWRVGGRSLAVSGSSVGLSGLGSRAGGARSAARAALRAGVLG